MLTASHYIPDLLSSFLCDNYMPMNREMSYGQAELPSLLSLPRELRDQIIELVLRHHQETTQRHLASGNGDVAPTSLLTTCHQLRAETRRSIAILLSPVLKFDTTMRGTWLIPHIPHMQHLSQQTLHLHIYQPACNLKEDNFPKDYYRSTGLITPAICKVLGTVTENGAHPIHKVHVVVHSNDESMQEIRSIIVQEHFMQALSPRFIISARKEGLRRGEQEALDRFRVKRPNFLDEKHAAFGYVNEVSLWFNRKESTCYDVKGRFERRCE